MPWTEIGYEVNCNIIFIFNYTAIGNCVFVASGYATNWLQTCNNAIGNWRENFVPNGLKFCLNRLGCEVNWNLRSEWIKIVRLELDRNSTRTKFLVSIVPIIVKEEFNWNRIYVSNSNYVTIGIQLEQDVHEW